LICKVFFVTTSRELLTTMTLFTSSTAWAPVMTILIEVIAGDMKVDPPSSGCTF